jgi:hypothetical protein
VKAQIFTVTYTDKSKDVFDVTAAQTLAKKRPTTTVGVEHERRKIGATEINKAHVSKVNLKEPVIVAHTQAGLMVIDGHHRLEKAHQLGRERLPAKVLTPAQSRNLAQWGPKGPPK